jgi:type IV pilus assembly protein PilW
MKRFSCFVHGFSLLEILLASALGVLLLSGFLEIYLSHEKLSSKQNDLALTAENTRFLTSYLTSSIRQAGFAGCANLNNLQIATHNFKPALTFSLITSLQGFTADDAPSYMRGVAAANTDILVIEKADTDTTRLIGEAKAGAKLFYVYKNPATENNKILLISDCEHADLFAAKNIVVAEIAVSGSGGLKFGYGVQDAEVSAFTELTYFIADTGRQYTNGKPIYALFFKVNRGDREELVAGVNDLKITYGVYNLQSKNIDYYNAAEIKTRKLWDKVSVVRLLLGLDLGQDAKRNLQLDIALRERVL